MDMFSNDAMQAALGFAIHQTSHVEAAVNETIYPDIQYPRLVPVDTSAHPFARTVTYFSSDKFGKADWINGNSDDIPLAGTEMQKHETSIHMAGVGYGWGYEEINQAQMLGHNLPADDAMAARRAYEEMVDGVALRGDARKGFNGLIDNPAVTANAVPNGNWAAANEYDMLEDVNTTILGVGRDTLYTSMADTLLLSHEKFVALSTKAFANDGTMTVLEFLRKNNTYTAMTGQELTIMAIRGLDTAGVGNTSRMIAYRRSPEVLKLHIPMPHRFMPVYQDGPLNFVVPGIFRLGGLDVRRPKEVRYGDGI